MNQRFVPRATARQNADSTPPRRVRVTNPRAAHTPRQPASQISQEIDESTAVGEVYIRSLVSAQLRLALIVLGSLASVLITTPLFLAFVPRLTFGTVAGIPVTWLVLGVAIYPFFMGLAQWHVYLAHRTEETFTHLVLPAADTSWDRARSNAPNRREPPATSHEAETADE